jgi:large repetitive protein
MKIRPHLAFGSKRIKSTGFFILALLLTSALAFGQVEICNNGIDDDFDGFIDCYDGSCANDSACDGIFLGNDANCSVPPPQFPQFTMTLDFASPNETTNHLSRMAIGDLDRDGMPEFVTMNRYTNKLFILNGNDGSIKHEATVNWTPQWEVAIGNVDNDNCAEIYFIGYQDPPGPNNDGIYLFAYDCQLNFIWQTAQRLPRDPINFGLADFDGDGLIELYAKDEIYDAHTGVRIVKTTAPNYARINGGPVAVDMEGDANLELVIGLSIYQVNLGNRGVDAGSLTLLKNRPEYFIRYEYNATSIADFNQDGFLDVIASGSTINHNTNTTIFYWDVHNDVVQTYRDLTSGYGANGWGNGTGRVNIADLDGDGQLNASYVSGKYLYALKEDLTLLWRIVINEETSGYTGCTLFDFNGDGKSEIVYRDEQFLYILDGTDGSIYNQQNCISRTNREYPIVADVDADGSTELCVTCGFNDVDAKNNFNNLNYSRFSHIRAFKSAAEPWVPARRVWNQHGYFVVNVNDDLTIPKVLQKHQLVFSNGSCTQGPNRPLNKFLNQSPFLNSEGCPTYASPDIAFSIAPTVKPPTCPDLNFTVSFQITNLGDVGLSGNIPVTFYTTNPLLPGAVKLNTITISLPDFKPNDLFDVVDANVTGIGADSLYVVLNDAGTTVPTPISLPNTTFFECDYDNILGVPVIPKPVTITAIEVNGNEKCASPDNGSARAFIPINGGGENTADYNFYWSIGAVAKPFNTADFVGPIYTGLVEGTYTVYAIHKTASCSSDTVQVVINAIQSIVPPVTVNVTHQTQCNPPNGRLEAVVAGGNTGYTFAWFDNAASLGITTAVANGLIGGNYTVQVSRNGCSVIVGAIVEDNAPDPDVSVASTPVTNCQNPNSGTVTATISVGGIAQPASDYSYDWYFYNNATSTQGSQLPAIHGTGPTRTGLAAGFYQVVATNINTQCPSIPDIIEIENQTTIPVVTITELAPQTSCDPLNPNGRLQANVTIGGIAQPAADFTFEWFIGQNTLPVNLHTEVSGINGSIAEKVNGGGQAYTVKATSNQQCSSTDDFVISETLVNPIVTLNAAPNGICDPALVSGSVTFQGSVTANVTFGGNPVTDFTGYSFEWYNGTQAVGPKRPESSSALSALNGGFYTLVVTRSDISCSSIPKTAEVLNTTVLPVISTNVIGSTNCLPAFANGQALVTNVDGAGTGSPYAFKWFNGLTTTTPVIGTGASLTNIQGGTGASFTVQVVNQTNGCQNTVSMEVPDSRVIPNVTLTQTPNSICNASLTNPSVNFNGAATANISNLIGAITSYTFTWRNGQLITDPINNSSTTQNLNNVNGGYYTVVAVQSSTGCASSPVSVEVLNNTVNPVISTSAVPSTNCLPALANGQASVTSVDGVGVSSPYVFSWHTGNNTLTPGIGVTPAITNLQGGVSASFTVLVTNQTNGCQNTRTVLVPDNKSNPVLTLTSLDNENCSAPFSGSASVNTITYQGLPEGLGGYTFLWTHGPTTSTITGLNAGTFELRATRTNVGCTSSPVQIDVQNNIYTPDINVVIANQTSCTSPNGNLSATIDETSIGGSANETNGYAFQWTNNGNPLVVGGTAVGITPAITSLAGNLFYSISVERTATRCTNTQSVFLPERILLPRIELVATDIVDCNTQGFVTARIFIDKNNDGDSNDAGDELTPAEIAADYTIAWFRGNSTTGTPLAETDRILNELSTGIPLPAGNYTAIATNNVTNCKTSDFTDVINGPGPLFNLDVEINNRPASCADSDGVITAFVDTGGGVPAPFGDFTFQWFQGNPTNGLDIPTPSFYTDPEIQFVTPALQIDPNSLFGNVYPGTPSPQAPTSVNTGPTLFGRPSGTYSVVVQRNSDGCKEFKTVFLPFLQEPVIILARIKPDECLGDVGEIEVELTAPFPPNNYLLQIYSNTNPVLGTDVPDSQFTAAAVGNVFNNLASGIYTIVARENPAIIPTACYSSPVLVKLIEALPPLVDILGSGANTSCVSAPVSGDGSLQVRVTTDANDPFSASYPLPPPPTILQKGAAPFVTYSIDVRDGANIAVPGYPTGSTFEDGDVENITGLRGETYTITVTSSKGCTTTKTFGVPNSPRVADLSGDVAVLPALACDPLLETNASIEVRRLSIADVIVNDNLSDYQFDWFNNVALSSTILSSIGDNNPAVKGGEVLSNVGPPLPSLPVTAGSYWVRATKVVAGASGGLGCLTAPFKVDISDNSRKPTAILSATADTSCETVTFFEGTVSIEITNPGSMVTPDYDYSWTSSGVSVIANDPNANGSLLNVTGLSDGTYQLSFRNNTSGCVGTAETTVLKSATPVVVNNATAIDQFICNPDGSITVGANDILVGGVVDNDHTRFDFTWARGDESTIVLGPTQGEDILDNSNLLTIGADAYFVKVKKRSGISPGSGCESAPFRVDILDKSVDPTVALVSLPNTSCEVNTNFEGSVNITVTNPGSVPTPTYDYTWTTPALSPIANGVSNGDGLAADDNFVGLIDGSYEVTVRNNVSGCIATASTVITQQSTPIIIVNATAIDQLICNPDGSITVGPNDILVNGIVDGDHTHFDFTWARGTTTNVVVGPTQSEDILAVSNLPTISADAYFVKVKKRSGLNPGSGCESVPLRVDILDKSRAPIMEFTSVIPNSSCTPSNPNGFLQATAAEFVGPIGIYNFNWTFNGGALPPTALVGGASPVSEISNAGPGTYGIEVINTNTGCRFTQSQVLQTNQTLSLPSIIDIDTVNPTNCFPQGSVRVVAVTIGGTTVFTNPPDDLDTDYDYEWYNDSFPAGLIGGQQNSLLPNVLPGKYYVRVKNVITECFSSAVEAVVDSTDIVYPVVSIQQIAPQVICSTNTGSGALNALADGQTDSNANYQFNWFSNLSLSGASFASTSSINGLIAGDYSLEVLDITTNCKSSGIFILPEDSFEFKPVLALSSNPLTLCNSNDGSVFARAVPFAVTADPVKNYPFAYNYTADLYVGDPPANFNNPEFPNMSPDPNNPLFTENYVQEDLPNGVYTVRLTDNNTGCVTIDKVTIDDLRTTPLPIVTTIAPVTNCDPANPNGVARVTVDGLFVGYQFSWYEGNAVAGTPIYEGVEYGSLKVSPQVYTVEAINIVTGCIGSVQASIANGTVPIPLPQIDIISHVTSCLFNNGALKVSVGGVTKDFVFDWYDGSTESPPSDFVGEIYDSLAAGTYSVTATSVITGCKSPLVSKAILEQKVFPEFDFQIQSSTCNLADGFATLNFTSTNETGLIEWFSGNQVVATGPNLIDVISGIYSVRVISDLGCETEKEIEIPAEIRPRNGISRNGDSQNDYFHIDCIDQFESNNVKVFNRAGTLVYEADGYDNSSIFFDGISNKGISIIGNNVPDGTYFFIIDKRNGSKPIAGYLEIVK